MRCYERTSCLLEKLFFTPLAVIAAASQPLIYLAPPPSDFLDPPLLREPHISDTEKRAYDCGIGWLPFTFENIPYLRAPDPI